MRLRNVRISRDINAASTQAPSRMTQMRSSVMEVWPTSLPRKSLIACQFMSLPYGAGRSSAL
jgi:hypothetical protein